MNRGLTAPQDTEKRPALVLGDDPVNVLGVARNLGRSAVPVHRLGASDDPVLRSRYVRGTRVVPGLDDLADDEYVALLHEMARGIGGRAVLYPLSDLHVLKVSRNAADLARSFLPLAADAAVAETLVNKRRFYTSLAERGVPHPASRFPASREEFHAAAEEIGYPVFLKPEISPLFARRFRLKGLVARDGEELDRHFDTLQPAGLNVMVQEIIPGDAQCMHGCAGFKAGARVWTFTYRRLREFPPGFGCGSLMSSVPDIAGRTPLVAYLTQIGYEGIFDAEFKLDPRDEVFKLIEINARSWWQNELPSASGFNIIKAAFDHAHGGTVELGDYRHGVLWMHLYNDFHARRAAGVGLARWLRSLGSVGAFDVWARDDVRPMLAYLAEVASRRFRKPAADAASGRNGAGQG